MHSASQRRECGDVGVLRAPVFRGPVGYHHSERWSGPRYLRVPEGGPAAPALKPSRATLIGNFRTFCTWADKKNKPDWRHVHRASEGQNKSGHVSSQESP